MFKIIQQSIRTGIVTTTYPETPANVPPSFRGKPVFDFEGWLDARPAAEVCPTQAISVRDDGDHRTVTVDYGRCVFCGLCAEAGLDQAVRVTQEFELATRDRGHLILTAEYQLHPDGTQRQLLDSATREDDVETAGRAVHTAIHKLLGRSLAIRQVDAGSCNGCEIEIVALNNPIYDIERFGIHFVASPRHADMLLVTGPVTRNMELALLKTYRATPAPKVVVAVGAWRKCGGRFRGEYIPPCGEDEAAPVEAGCPERAPRAPGMHPWN